MNSPTAHTRTERANRHNKTYSAFSLHHVIATLFLKLYYFNAFSVEGKEEGEEGGWIWRAKTWKGLELRREAKSIGSHRKYFRAVATPKEKDFNAFSVADFKVVSFFSIIRTF